MIRPVNHVINESEYTESRVNPSARDSITADEDSDDLDPKKRRKKLIWIIVGIVIFLLIVLGVVLFITEELHIPAGVNRYVVKSIS